RGKQEVAKDKGATNSPLIKISCWGGRSLTPSRADASHTSSGPTGGNRTKSSGYQARNRWPVWDIPVPSGHTDQQRKRATQSQDKAGQQIHMVQPKWLPSLVLQSEAPALKHTCPLWQCLTSNVKASGKPC
ncbi:Hypothetical predicted protein, partial [Pelobates cultripes]